MTREVPDFKPGDTVDRAGEGGRRRSRARPGVRRHRHRDLQPRLQLLVHRRKISHGEGVERTFQTYSPSISEIRSSAVATCVARSCTTCATWRASPRVSKRRSDAGTGDEHRCVRFVHGLWRGLDVLRRFLHLVVLLVVFGFVIGALRGSTPVVPVQAALARAARRRDRRAADRASRFERAVQEAHGNAARRDAAVGSDRLRSVPPPTTRASRPSLSTPRSLTAPARPSSRSCEARSANSARVARRSSPSARA